MPSRTKITIAAIAVLLVSAGVASAQSAVATAGGEVTGSGTMSYTIGQTFLLPLKSDAGSITPGVQQAYVITTLSGQINSDITLEAAVYPNPVIDRLTLRVGDIEAANLRYTLTDAGGRTIRTGSIVTAAAKSGATIDMGKLSTAVYLLRVTDGDKPLKTFKIVKK
jgi:hypothetical protein